MSADSNEAVICSNSAREWAGHVESATHVRLVHELGVEKVSFDRLLAESNVLVRLAPELYGLIGSSGSQATIAEPGPIALATPIQISESPIEESIEPTIVESGPFLDGCDPGSPDFPPGSFACAHPYKIPATASPTRGMVTG